MTKVDLKLVRSRDNCRPNWLSRYHCAVLMVLGLGACNASNVDSVDGAGGSPFPKAHVKAQLAVAPLVASQLGDFAIYSREASMLRDRATTGGGWLGSSGSVEMGVDARVRSASVQAGADVLLRERARVEGDVVSGGTVTRQNGIVVTGTITEHASVPPIDIPLRAVTPATSDVWVYSGQSRSLAAGSYNEVHVYGGGQLTLSAGTYQMAKLIVEAGSAGIALNVAGGKITVNTAAGLSLGDRTVMTMVGGSDASLVELYSNQTAQVYIETDCTLYGTVMAPNAEISVASRTQVHGALYGKRVSVDTDSNVTRETQPWPGPGIFSEPTGSPAFIPRSTGGVLRWRPVAVNVATLLPPGQRITLNMFADVNLPAIGVRIERNGTGGYVWMGEIVNQPHSMVALSVQGSVVSGLIQTGDNKVYQVRWAGNGVHVVRAMDQMTFPEGHQIAKDVPIATPDPCGGTDDGHNIDTMIAYTTAVRTALGGAEAALSFVYLSIATTNQTYINSGIDQRLRLVHVTEVDYTEDATMDADFDNLQAGSVGSLLSLRTTHGADILTLLVDNGQYCGLSYVMTNVSTGFESFANNVVQYDCADTNYSLAHEDGHIMGAKHDRYVDTVEGEPYTYNFGYLSLTDKWRTVMAYASACSAAGTTCPRVPYFSNPDVTYGGDPMGIAEGETDAADNRRTLDNTAATVANFRCTSPGTNNVWMRDTWDDTGAEPDSHTTGQAMWESPYIWVRNSRDTTLVHQHQHENPIFGATNWVYAKLHNGAATAMSGQLEIYYANASTDLTWPAGWTLLGSVAVNDFEAHSSRIVELQWSSLPGTGHYCLLARWVSASDPMKVVEGANIEANVRNNNNLVWKNVAIIARSPDGTADVAFDMKGKSRTYALAVAPTPEEANGSFLLYGKVTVTLEPDALRAWIAGGKKGSGFAYDSSTGKIAIIDPAGATLSNIYLPGPCGSPTGRAYRVGLHVERPATTPARNFHLRATQLVRAPTIADPGLGSGVADAPLPGYVAQGGVTYELQP